MLPKEGNCFLTAKVTGSVCRYKIIHCKQFCKMTTSSENDYLMSEITEMNK